MGGKILLLLRKTSIFKDYRDEKIGSIIVGAVVFFGKRIVFSYLLFHCCAGGLPRPTFFESGENAGNT